MGARRDDVTVRRYNRTSCLYDVTGTLCQSNGAAMSPISTHCRWCDAARMASSTASPCSRFMRVLSRASRGDALSHQSCRMLTSGPLRRSCDAVRHLPCEFRTGRRADPPWMKLAQFVARSFHRDSRASGNPAWRGSTGVLDSCLRRNDGRGEAGVGVSC